MTTYSLFYVLNGLVDGERGVMARTAGFDEPMRDGHYWLPDDGSTSDGHGPYESWEDAVDAARRFTDDTIPTQTWLFPVGGKPRRIDDDYPDDATKDGSMVATIARLDDANIFECTMLGSYETLVVRVSCSNHRDASHVVGAAIAAQAEVM